MVPRKIFLTGFQQSDSFFEQLRVSRLAGVCQIVVGPGQLAVHIPPFLRLFRDQPPNQLLQMLQPCRVDPAAVLILPKLHALPNTVLVRHLIFDVDSFQSFQRFTQILSITQLCAFFFAS